MRGEVLGRGGGVCGRGSALGKGSPCSKLERKSRDLGGSLAALKNSSRSLLSFEHGSLGR